MARVLPSGLFDGEAANDVGENRDLAGRLASESCYVRIKELTSSVETKNETFVWCDGRICQKRASNGSTVLRNYFEQGFEEGSSDYVYTRDHLGSVREVVASDGTTIASRRTYDPWGKVTETGSGALTDFGFTGHYFDRPTGLGLPQYRGYDPNLGRWLSRDPAGLRGGLNLYGYVNNDPMNFFDPNGEAAVAAAPAAAAAAGAALALWGAWDCAVNGCRGIKKLMDDLLGKPYCPTRDKEKEKEKKGECGNPVFAPGAPPTCTYTCEDGTTVVVEHEVHAEYGCAPTVPHP